MGARGFGQHSRGRAIGFSSLLCYPLMVPLVNIRGHSDDCIEGIVNPVGFGESVLNEGRQVFSIPDQLVIITKPSSACVLFEQHRVILDYLSPLPQLFKRHKHVASLVDYLELCAESSDKCRIVSIW